MEAGFKINVKKKKQKLPVLVRSGLGLEGHYYKCCRQNTSQDQSIFKGGKNRFYYLMRGSVVTCKEGKNCQWPYLGAIAQIYINVLVFFVSFFQIFIFLLSFGSAVNRIKRKKNKRNEEKYKAGYTNWMPMFECGIELARKC